jgi:hypothetical protein
MSGEKTAVVKVAAEQMDIKTQYKARFILNAIEKGWSVKKRKGSFVFSKKHEGKKEICMDDYLDTFVGEMI